MGDEKTTHIESTNPNAPGPKLLNSFLGLPLGYEFLILSCDYRNQRWTSLNGSKKGQSMIMRTALDVKRMESWGKKFPTVEDEHIVIVKNRELTKSSLIENIKRFRSVPSAKVVYVGGHAIQTDDGFIYLPVDWASGMDYTQGVTSNEMSELLIGASPQSTLTLILITDFCFSFNFLRLPYVLVMNPDGSFLWEDSNEFEHGTSWNDEHKILQFAGSAKSAPTYEFESTASIFSLALYSCDPNEPKSLSERVRFMRNGITTFLGKYNERNNLPEGLRQDVQIYASHKWDLETPMALPDLISNSRPV